MWQRMVGVLGVLCICVTVVVGQTSEATVYDKFLSFAATVLNSANFWNKLGTYQAKTVITNVYTDAEHLYQKKALLKQRIIAGQMTKHDLESQAVEITADIREFVRQLEKFTGEISKATDLEAGDALEAIHRAASARIVEMAELTSLDLTKPEQRDRAIAILDAALCQLKKIEKASKCLSDSIDKKKQACDPAQLQKDDCSPKPAV